METKRSYWGYRICTDYIQYFNEELKNGNLRQGWGYDPRQDLRKMTLDDGAGANLRMKKQVKKGDYLLVPRLPNWNSVTIVRATQDWETGYDFRIEKHGDFGHIFPAEIICAFNRNSEVVTGNIRTTLRNPGRFWNINYLADDIERIVAVRDNPKLLTTYQSKEDRFSATIESCYKDIFKSREFAAHLSATMQNQFRDAEWENALVCGLKELFPTPFFTIKRTGGITEKQHGTDVLVKFTNPLSQHNYIIAIQIKDYSEKVLNIKEIVEQINRASYWDNNESSLIEKILIITRAEKNENLELEQVCEENQITLIMGNELSDIITQIGLRHIANNFPYSER